MSEANLRDPVTEEISITVDNSRRKNYLNRLGFAGNFVSKYLLSKGRGEDRNVLHHAIAGFPVLP